MNKQIKSGQRGSNRHFGLEGSGKGDSDRTTDAAAYAENLNEVAFPRVAPQDDPSFRRTKAGRYVKSYGMSQKTYEQTNEAWPV